MQNIEEQKKRLEQKKARMQLEETRLKIKERKARTRDLIEMGGLVTKAGIDYLPSNALYGALLSIKKALDNNENIIPSWTKKGSYAFDKEKQNATPVILSFAQEPEKDIRDNIRSLGLRFNRFRQEWYGHTKDIAKLKECIAKCKYDIEILEENF